TWMTVSWMHKGAPSVLGAAAGAVAGLVAITPASGYVDVSAAILIGLGAGTFCYVGIQLTKRLKVDDALDIFGVHGIGGMWGALATGIFATVAVNAGAADGLAFGNPGQLGVQAIAVVASRTCGVVVARPRSRVCLIAGEEPPCNLPRDEVNLPRQLNTTGERQRALRVR